MSIALAFDVVLALALPLLAWRVLVARQLFTCVVLFIALGLLISAAYVRLEAPDLALAEAAVGAGVTGALLLETIARLGEQHSERR